MKQAVKDYIYSPEFSLLLNMFNLTSEEVEKKLIDQPAIQDDIELFFCGDEVYAKLMGQSINEKIINFIRSENYLTEWEMTLWGL